MPIDDKLIEVLCCPASQMAVKKLSGEQVEKLNQAIAQGKVRFKNESLVEKSVEEGLITEDGNTLYLVDSGIPIMLIEHGVAAEQIPGL